MQTTDVRQTAENAVNQSKSFLSNQVDERSTLIGQQIESVAGEVRNVGQQLGSSGVTGPVANYLNKGADAVESFGKYLQSADSGRLIGDLEDLARRRPLLMAAGALVAGFAASRFLKTSSARRYRAGESGDVSGSTYGGGAGYGTTTGYGGGTGYGTSGYDSGAGTSTFDDSYGDTTGVRSGGERYAT